MNSSLEAFQYRYSPEEGKEPALLPERQHIPEKVTVVGAGIAGMSTAWVLSEIGYDVTIMDQLDGLMQGTSKGALGVHLGGRYPKSEETARECLNSAVLVKKLMPFAINERLGTLRFLVADTSDVSFEQFVRFYAGQRDYYASLPTEDQVFGPPENFFRLLQERELKNFANVQGGIASQEQLWDMPRVRHVLTDTLQARGVKFLIGTRVNTIAPSEDGFDIAWEAKDGRLGIDHSDVVINTAGYGARELSQTLGDAPQQNLQLRFFSDFKISKETQRRYPFPFVMIPGYMHYVPLEEGIASIMGFSEIVDSLIVPKDEPLTLPEHWQTIMKSGVIFEDKRARSIVDTARSRFMPDIGKNATAISLQPGVAVSFHQEQHIKQQSRPSIVEGLPGYLTLVPTKASHGISLGLEAAGHVLRNSAFKGTVQQLDPYTQEVSAGRQIAYIDHSGK